ncbi:34194_t:CDS:2, partial [Gigaspora margarita]
LSYLNCTYHLDVEEAQQTLKAQIFNALANSCHNIINIKATVWSRDEAIALANLICSQKWLKKFSLVNSNESASFSIQSLQSQAGSLNNLTFKNMHQYIYGNYNIHDGAPPVEILSNIVKINSKTIENIIFDWHSRNPPECTQLIKNIAECTINLEQLKTPLYT